MELGRHSLVSGPQISGKEEMIRGVAQLLGRFLFSYSCSTHSNSQTLSRIVEGMAQVITYVVCHMVIEKVCVCVCGAGWVLGLSD